MLLLDMKKKCFAGCILYFCYVTITSCFVNEESKIKMYFLNFLKLCFTILAVICLLYQFESYSGTPRPLEKHLKTFFH